MYLRQPPLVVPSAGALPSLPGAGWGSVDEDWSPTFVDYFHFAFATATAFSPTDVSAVKPWAKLMLMAESALSLVMGILVVARAVNILK